MKVNTVRFIDKYIGPICLAICRFHMKLKLWFSQSPPHDMPGKILVIKFWGIGNIIECSPALKALREVFPYQHITFVTLNSNKGVYEKNNLYDTILYLDIGNPIRFVLSLYSLIDRIREIKYDILIDLEPLTHFTPLVSYMSGCKIRWGFKSGNTSFSGLYTNSVYFNQKQHISQSFMDMVKALGYEGEDISLEYPRSNDSTKSEIEDLLDSLGIKQGKMIVGINPNASDVAVERRWPSERFAEIADFLVEEYDAVCIYIGSSGEAGGVENTIKMMKNPAISTAGKTTLPELIALIARFDIFITNDSGPLHLAMALNVPTLSFFGPESPLVYGPRESIHRVLYKGGDCSPCISFSNAKQVSCRKNAECIKSISVEDAKNTLKMMVKEIKS